MSWGRGRSISLAAVAWRWSVAIRLFGGSAAIVCEDGQLRLWRCDESAAIARMRPVAGVRRLWWVDMSCDTGYRVVHACKGQRGKRPGASVAWSHWGDAVLL